MTPGARSHTRSSHQLPQDFAEAVQKMPHPGRELAESTPALESDARKTCLIVDSACPRDRPCGFGCSQIVGSGCMPWTGASSVRTSHKTRARGPGCRAYRRTRRASCCCCRAWFLAPA
eukprot:s1134_g4.t1